MPFLPPNQQGTEGMTKIKKNLIQWPVAWLIVNLQSSIFFHATSVVDSHVVVLVLEQSSSDWMCRKNTTNVKRRGKITSTSLLLVRWHCHGCVVVVSHCAYIQVSNLSCKILKNKKYKFRPIEVLKVDWILCPVPYFGRGGVIATNFANYLKVPSFGEWS